MEENRRETDVRSEGQYVINGDEAMKNSSLDGQEVTQDENQADPMERTKEVMESIGIMINSI